MKFAGIKEYAAARGLSYSTVYTMCRDGTLPVLKIGRRHMIEINGADRYFEGQIAAGQERQKKLKSVAETAAPTRTLGNSSSYLTQLSLIRKAGAV